MQSMIHILNIGTLATWLSVAGFGAVGVIVPRWHPSPMAPAVVETTVFDRDFTLGDPEAPQSTGEFREITPDARMEVLPAPPEMPPMAEIPPLPEIPAIPARAAATDEAPAVRKSAARRASKPATIGRPTARASADRADGAGVAAAPPMSSADRLAAGRMPQPAYPAECRRKGQSGTVVVEFTVDGTGRVISAHAKSPSPWPLLDHEAIRTVRRWKFPPGGVMKLQRPIVFQLR